MEIKPFYCVLGEDAFQKDLFLKSLRKTLFPQGSGGMNDDRFDLKETPMAQVLDLANAYPMFAAKKLIVLDCSKDLSQEDEEKLEAYLASPSPHTVLVLCLAKADKRKKFIKFLTDKKLIHPIDPPNLADMPLWVDKICTTRSLKISPSSKRLLIDYVGANLFRLDQELEKIKLFIHPLLTIEDRHVQEMVIKTSGENVFALSDHFFEGKKTAAIQTFRFQLLEGTPPLVMLSLFIRHIKILLTTHWAQKKGIAQNELPKLLGVPPFVVSKYTAQTRQKSREQLKTIFLKLKKMDQEFKSHPVSPELLFEAFLLNG